MKQLIISFLLSIFVFFAIVRVDAVKADTLLIQDDGAVLLLVGNGAVLATTTITTPGAKKADPKKETPHQTVPLVSSETKSVINITPPKTNDKKIQVTITTLPKTPTPTVPTPSITKTVDSVVAQDKSGNVVLDIRSSGQNSLTINNQNSAANTNLPLQINTQTHELNVVSQGQTQKINVLPNTAIGSLLETGTISGASSATKPAVSLTKQKGDVVYQIQAENSAKILGRFEVKWPVTVVISAQTGKTIFTQQPLFGSLLRIFSFGK